MSEDLENLHQMEKIEIDRVKYKYTIMKTESIERNQRGKFKRKSIPKADKEKVRDQNKVGNNENGDL